MIFPKIFGFENQEDITVLPRLKEYAYDMKLNEFKYKNGKHYFVYDNDALQIWILKAFKTTRNKYIAYTSNFGNEIDSLVGTTVSTAIKKEELKRYIVETLMCNPYIKSIDDIVISHNGDNYSVNVYLVSIYGDEIEEVKCEIDWI